MKVYKFSLTSFLVGIFSCLFHLLVYFGVLELIDNLGLSTLFRTQFPQEAVYLPYLSVFIVGVIFSLTVINSFRNEKMSLEDFYFWPLESIPGIPSEDVEKKQVKLHSGTTQSLLFAFNDIYKKMQFFQAVDFFRLDQENANKLRRESAGHLIDILACPDVKNDHAIAFFAYLGRLLSISQLGPLQGRLEVMIVELIKSEQSRGDVFLNFDRPPLILRECEHSLAKKYISTFDAAGWDALGY